MPIFLSCPNGHALRLKDKMAGRRGSCPKCGAEFVAPTAVAPDPTQTETFTAPPPEDPGAIEWALTLPDGERFGPTVPTLFAQWITAGRVPADALVWRTGWDSWRTAEEAEAELPAPLPVVPPPPPPQPAAAPKPKPSRPATGQVSYALRRRRQTERRKRLATVLAVACLLLVVMLGVLLYVGPVATAPSPP